MKYPALSYSLPVDESLKEFYSGVPRKYIEDTQLMDCLLRFVRRIEDLPDISKGINPFYKVVEMLELCERQNLQYIQLQTIDEYYHIGIIRYLTNGGLGEKYTFMPCNSATELKKSLSSRNNQTTGNTLRNILANMI